MKETTISSLFTIIVFIQWRNTIPLVAAGVYKAKLTGVMAKDNEYFTVEKDPSAKSGWAIITKKDVKLKISGAPDTDFFIHFLTRTDPKEEFKSVVVSYLCSLLAHNYIVRTRNFLPKEIAGLIFPRKYDRDSSTACEFTKEEVDNPMGGKVHAGAGENIATRFPTKVPYELEARIIKARNTTDYLVKFSFDIGKKQTANSAQCQTNVNNLI